MGGYADLTLLDFIVMSLIPRFGLMGFAPRSGNRHHGVYLRRSLGCKRTHLTCPLLHSIGHRRTWFSFVERRQLFLKVDNLLVSTLFHCDCEDGAH